MKAKYTLILVISLASALFVSCSSAPVTGRGQLSLTSDTAVVKMSIQSFEQMKAKMPISNHRGYNEMLTNVGERIAQQVFSDQPLAEWEFVVFDLPDINALAMPGGKVAIFTGLFQVVKDEDELAAVIAHEIAHVTAHHTHEKISQAMVMGGMNAVAGMAASMTGLIGLGSSGGYIDMRQTIMGIWGMGTSGVMNSWDRGKESEADHIGIIYMAKAGYDPQAAIRVMERMAEMEYGTEPTFGTTHPSSQERLNELYGYIDEAKVEYEIAKEFNF